MKSKQSGHETKHVPAEPVPASDIRVSREAIAAAEHVLGRSLRSDVPDLPPERQGEKS